jgi:hypothetical protein
VKTKEITILAILFSLVMCTLTFGSEDGILKFQGLVMTVDVKKSSLVVNERLIVWDKNTVVSNEKGTPASIEKLKARDWVFVEGVLNRSEKRIEAKKIYLLPKRIDGKEKRQYAFFE